MKRPSKSMDAGSFLLATPALNDTYFKDCIVFLVEFCPPMSAWGLVLNHTVHMPLDEVFNRDPKSNVILQRPLHTFFFGGPEHGTSPFQELTITILETNKTAFEKAPHDPNYADRTHSFYGKSYEIKPGVFIYQVPPGTPLPVSQLTAPANSTTRIFFGYADWLGAKLEADVNEGLWEVSNVPPVKIFAQSREKTILTPSIFREIYSA
ncbi:hypothetical protein AGMMS49938_00060 [Fibrobacterales bacterium]|nr:hypothetical protein AGMMS49938_00060 [Fibrobacterales bacterium]